MNEHAGVVAKALESRGVWWLNPAVAFGVPAVVAGFIAYSADSAAYREFWRTAKYFDLSCFGLLLAVATVFICGCLFGGARRRGADRLPAADWTLAIRWQSVRLLFRLSFILTILAYSIWFAIAVKNGLNLGVILDAIDGVSSLPREHLATIPGVTTATQFGLAVVTLAVPLAAATGWRSVRWECYTVFALAFVRAFLNNERLAVIELLVPFAVSFIWLRPASSRRLRLLTQSAPVIATVLLYLVFAVAEYFRSWSSFYSSRESNFWGFMGLRLTGYYATALNNGALLWKVNEPLSIHMPLATLGFMHRLPLLKDLLPFLRLEDFPSQRYGDLLTSSANAEFNNPSGIFGPIVDYGVAGGLLYWLLCGLICGFLYKEFKRRSASGIFLYPALYISLIEATRILYWATGRFFPDMFLLVVGVLLFFRKTGVPAVCRLSLDADTTPG